MITAATAYAFAVIYRTTLDAKRVALLDAATDIARTHPMVDVLDIYCDGIEAMREMFPASRALAVDKLHREILIASIWCRA